MLAHFIRVVSEDDFKIIMKFVEKNEGEIKFTSPIANLLRLTIRGNDFVTFDTILKYDIDVNVFANSNQSSSLIIASYLGLPNFVERLLEKKADVSLRDKDDDTALSACFKRCLTDDQIKCAKLLIKAGSDIECLNKQGDNKSYHIALLLKENLRLENSLALNPIEANKPSDDPLLIRAVTTNPNAKVQKKIILSPTLYFNIDSITSTENMTIELPMPGEKIIGHMLLPSMSSQEIITKAMMAQCLHDIIVKNTDGKVEIITPNNIYL